MELPNFVRKNLTYVVDLIRQYLNIITNYTVPEQNKVTKIQVRTKQG